MDIPAELETGSQTVEASLEGASTSGAKGSFRTHQATTAAKQVPVRSLRSASTLASSVSCSPQVTAPLFGSSELLAKTESKSNAVAEAPAECEEGLENLDASPEAERPHATKNASSAQQADADANTVSARSSTSVVVSKPRTASRSKSEVEKLVAKIPAEIEQESQTLDASQERARRSKEKMKSASSTSLVNADANSVAMRFPASTVVSLASSSLQAKASPADASKPRVATQPKSEIVKGIAKVPTEFEAESQALGASLKGAPLSAVKSPFSAAQTTADAKSAIVCSQLLPSMPALSASSSLQVATSPADSSNPSATAPLRSEVKTGAEVLNEFEEESQNLGANRRRAHPSAAKKSDYTVQPMTVAANPVAPRSSRSAVVPSTPSSLQAKASPADAAKPRATTRSKSEVGKGIAEVPIELDEESQKLGAIRRRAPSAVMKSSSVHQVNAATNPGTMHPQRSASTFPPLTSSTSHAAAVSVDSSEPPLEINLGNKTRKRLGSVAPNMKIVQKRARNMLATSVTSRRLPSSTAPPDEKRDAPTTSATAALPVKSMPLSSKTPTRIEKPKVEIMAPHQMKATRSAVRFFSS